MRTRDRENPIDEDERRRKVNMNNWKKWVMNANPVSVDVSRYYNPMIPATPPSSHAPVSTANGYVAPIKLGESAYAGSTAGGWDNTMNTQNWLMAYARAIR